MCGPGVLSTEVLERLATFRERTSTLTGGAASTGGTGGEVGISPFGAQDEIGMLNLLTPDLARSVLRDVDGGHIVDLSVELFAGMPTWTAGGEPPFQLMMTHTPRGTVVDDPVGVGPAQNAHVSWSADQISMFTHTGTHVDTLNHFGYDNRIWNGFDADEHLGSQGWRVAGADRLPPMVARGVLIDVAALHGVDVLPDSYGIGPEDLQAALRRQEVELAVGDVICLRTGRGSLWPDPATYLPREPGLTLAGARWLAAAGVSAIGSDTIALEQLPGTEPDNWMAVHTFLLAEAGVPIMEVMELEQLAAEQLYSFGFLGACLKIRGATAGPMRPLALPFAAR